MTNSPAEGTAMAGHELLLRLAGRIPDRVLALARRELADGAVSRAIAQLTKTFAQAPFPLTADELAAIRSLAGEGAGEGEGAALPAVYPVEEPPALQFEFVDLDDYGEAGRDELDEALVAAAEAHRAEITGVWRAWRYTRLDPRRAAGWAADGAARGGPGAAGEASVTVPVYSDPPYRVYVIEVENPGMIPGLSADLLRAVRDPADAGVEIIPLSEEPFPYQDEALAESLRLWSRGDPYLVVDRFADLKNGSGADVMTASARYSGL
jgi:hypothetical protein